MIQFKRKDYLMSLLIVVVTLLYFCDKFILTENINAINFFGLEIGSLGFPNINQLVYYSKMKIYILFISILWYITCNHWWKHAILIMISIELLKLFSALNPTQNFIDEVDYIFSLPITLPIIYVIFIVSKKINNYYLVNDLRKEISDEIDVLFIEINNLDKVDYDMIRKDFNNLLKLKNIIDSDIYLKQLISLRNDLYKKIN